MNNNRTLWAFLLLAVAALLLVACSTPQAEAVTESKAATIDAEQHADEHVSDEEHADGEHADGDMAMEHVDGDMDPEHAESMMEHEHAEVPDDFASLTNPFAGDDAAVAAGKEIFAANCIPCHGESGEGNGVAAARLNPKPANLADGTMMDMISDAYLYWRISKGGAVEPFNSAMPAWETVLTEDQRWQVISYVRSLSTGEHMDDDGHSN